MAIVEVLTWVTCMAAAARLPGLPITTGKPGVRGLFAGVSLEGSSINERNSVNERHYQRVGVRASELLQGLVPPRPAARGLLSALDALDAADGAVVSPQPAPPAYSDNNPFS